MICCDTELKFVFEGGIEEEVHGTNCLICNTIFHKKISQKHAYRFEGEDFICTKCGSEILVAEISHPIHDGPFPLSGSGKVLNEKMPFCPKCEEIPSTNGKFITSE